MRAHPWGQTKGKKYKRVKCAECRGTGRVRWRATGSASFTCVACAGRGYNRVREK